MEKDSFESLFNDAPTHTLYFDLELLQYHGNGDFPKYTDMRNPRHDVRIGLNSAGLQEMSLIADTLIGLTNTLYGHITLTLPSMIPVLYRESMQRWEKSDTSMTSERCLRISCSG